MNSLDQKNLEGFEMWCWRRTEKTSWTGRVKNEEVLYTVKEENNIGHEIEKRKAKLD
jgi:hypothetical protein